jgi:phage terminase small subunit
MSETTQKPFGHRLNKLIAGVSEQDKTPSEAARAAGYSESYSRVDVYSTLEKPRVKAEIERRRESRMAEANIHANEVLGTLVSHLRADLGDILPDNPIVKQAKAVGLSHLLRKVTVKEYFDKSKQATVTETTVELHNSQTAAKQLCAVMGLEVAAAKNPYDAARAAYERLILEHPSVNQTVIADRVAGVYGVKAELLYE